MATTKKQISYGSKGSEVSELQNTLNQNGYNLSVDGIFGKNTLNAVKDYQQKQGLSVDGIVGTQTWGALGGNKTSSSPTTQNPTNPNSTSTNNPYTNVDLSKYASGYKPSDSVTQADKKKSEAESLVDGFGDFTYSNQQMYDDVISKIMNREKFSYDLNGDALYQQYKDTFIGQGKMAMQDTMGQAAMMTGGYGNSYAQSVGNQAYQASLQQLNDKIPELYQMAYDKYNQEGQDMINQFGILDSQRSTEYGEWGDRYNKAVADRDYAANDYNNAYAMDYGQWSDAYNRDTSQYWNETNFGYGKDRDKISDEQWQAAMDYQAERDKVTDAQWREQFDYTKEQNEKTSSNAGKDVTPSQHTSMIDKIDEYKADGNASGLKSYLNSLVNKGWLSPEEAASYYEKFVEETDDPGATDIGKKYYHYSGGGGGGGVIVHELY